MTGPHTGSLGIHHFVPNVLFALSEFSPDEAGLILHIRKRFQSLYSESQAADLANVTYACYASANLQTTAQVTAEEALVSIDLEFLRLSDRTASCTAQLLDIHGVPAAALSAFARRLIFHSGARNGAFFRVSALAPDFSLESTTEPAALERLLTTLMFVLAHETEHVFKLRTGATPKSPYAADERHHPGPSLLMLALRLGLDEDASERAFMYSQDLGSSDWRSMFLETDCDFRGLALVLRQSVDMGIPLPRAVNALFSVTTTSYLLDATAVLIEHTVPPVLADVAGLKRLGELNERLFMVWAYVAAIISKAATEQESGISNEQWFQVIRRIRASHEVLIDQVLDEVRATLRGLARTTLDTTEFDKVIRAWGYTSATRAMAFWGGRLARLPL